MAQGFLLPHPWEPLIMAHGHEIAFRVRQYLLGQIEIKPKDQEGVKTITVLRVWPYDMTRSPKAPWYDLTYTQVQAAILPWLENPLTSSSKFHLKANAVGRRKNFTITVTP